MKKYDKLVRFDKDLKPIPDIAIQAKLEPGVYTVNLDNNRELFFSKTESNHDSLVDLPNTEYDIVVKELERFMTPNVKGLFEEYGFLYKRSTLLYGPPGTGKTCIVNRIIQKVVAEGGVVLFSPNPQLLKEAFNAIESLQPEARIMVVFEELDQLIQRFESDLLNLLDGEIQKSNVIYMATTNYIDKIPPRIRRPGRFSSVIQVGFPSAETRKFYLSKKLKVSKNVDMWVEKTEGFSIDELKETVLAVMCLGYKLDEIIKRVRSNKEGQAANAPTSENEDDDCYDEDGEEECEARSPLTVSISKN